MKRYFLTLVIAFGIFIGSAGGSHAKESMSPEFKAYWLKFQAAVAKGDSEAVAGLTNLPYPEITNGGVKNLDKAAFIKAYPTLFPAKVKTCVAAGAPVHEQTMNTYSLFCGDSIYIFNKVGTDWKFMEIGQND